MQEHDSRRGTLSDRLAQYAWGIGTIFWVIALAIASPPAVRLHAAPTVIAAYHFNEAGGATLIDVSGRNNHGALVNGPVWTAAGKYGGALTFDGVNDLVSIADAATLDLTTGMTIEAWVKPTSVSFTPVEVAADGLVLPQRVDLAEPGWVYDPATGILRVRRADTTSLRVSASASGTDTVAPVIMSVAASNVTAQTAIVSWVTNEFADSQVEYGLTTAYGSFSERDPSRVTSHSRTLVGLSPGTVYSYRALSRDAVGNLAVSDDATFTTSIPDTTPPSVAITAPSAGSTVSGSTVAVMADAADDAGIASVQFMIDGVNLGSADAVPPYSINWNSTTASNGVHTISARAVDTAGHPATSQAVTVTVSNAALSIITFNDLPSAGGALNGQYPSGVVDWGSNAWWRSGPWGQSPPTASRSPRLVCRHPSGSLRRVGWSASGRSTAARRRAP
jgi:hypothetical protein